MSPFWTFLLAVYVPGFACWIGCLAAGEGPQDWEPNLPPARLVADPP